MTTFALIPGAGGSAFAWTLVEPRLRAAGHTCVAVDLPADDAEAGLGDYADTVTRALPDGHRDVVLVAMSFGGFTAALVAQRIPVRAIVMVNAMIPLPGERAADWGDHTGSAAARTASDTDDLFFHDVPTDLAAAMTAHDRDETSRAWSQPCAFERWPQVPIRVLSGADERLFPAPFQARVARERLGVDNDVIPGGHMMTLANPAGTAARLLAYHDALLTA